MNEAGGTQILFVSRATYVSSTAVSCLQPPTAASAVATGFQYSHDSVYFSPGLLAPYLIVGPTRSIIVTAENPILVASEMSVLPNITVFLADAYGNKRYSLEKGLFTMQLTSIPPLQKIAGGDEVADFSSEQRALVATAVAGVASFTNVSLRNPLAGELQLYVFYTQDPARVYAALTLLVISGTPTRLLVTTHSAWIAGVLTALPLQPKPVLTLLDGAGNPTVGNETVARCLFSSDRVGGDGFPLAVMDAAFAFVGEDGTFRFDTLSVRTRFDVDAVLVFSCGASVPDLRVVLPQETCMKGVEYAVSGTFRCRQCPAHAMCDGTSRVIVTPGYWRSSIASVSIYPCDPPEACPASDTCAAGYEGPLCGVCQEGYGHSSGRVCGPCNNATVNWAVIVILFLVMVAIVFYLSLFTMPYGCVSDLRLLEQAERVDKVSLKRDVNTLSIVIKIALSHLQLLSMIPVSSLALPSWTVSFLQGADTASKFNPNLSFFGCTPLGARASNMLWTVLGLIPGIAMILVGAAYGIAWAKTYKGTATTIVKEKALVVEAHTQPGTALDKHVQRSRALALCEDPEHLKHVVHNYDELFGDDAIDATNLSQDDDDEAKEIEEEIRSACSSDVESITNMHCDEVASKRIDFEQRFYNGVLLSVLATLFFLFPTIVQRASALLSCEELNMVATKGGSTLIRVISVDPVMECSGPQYESVKQVALLVLIGLGFGIPLMSVLFVKVAQRLTCDGDPEVARLVFFFVTGGYANHLWFWEAVSLSRKLLLVLCVTLPSEPFLKVLAATWVMIASVTLNILLRPWALNVLQVTEITSLACVAITFGLIELASFSSVSSDDVKLTTVYAAVAFVNLVCFGVMGLAGLWSLRETIDRLANKKGALGHFFRYLQQLTSTFFYKGESVAEGVEAMQRKLVFEYQKSYAVAVADTVLSKIIQEKRDNRRFNTSSLSRRMSAMSAALRSPMGSFSGSIGSGASLLSPSSVRLGSPNPFSASSSGAVRLTERFPKIARFADAVDAVLASVNINKAHTEHLFREEFRLDANGINADKPFEGDEDDVLLEDSLMCSARTAKEELAAHALTPIGSLSLHHNSPAGQRTSPHQRVINLETFPDEVWTPFVEKDPADVASDIDRGNASGSTPTARLSRRRSKTAPWAPRDDERDDEESSSDGEMPFMPACGSDINEPKVSAGSSPCHNDLAAATCHLDQSLCSQQSHTMKPSYCIDPYLRPSPLSTPRDEDAMPCRVHSTSLCEDDEREAALKSMRARTLSDPPSLISVSRKPSDALLDEASCGEAEPTGTADRLKSSRRSTVHRNAVAGRKKTTAAHFSRTVSPHGLRIGGVSSSSVFNRPRQRRLSAIKRDRMEADELLQTAQQISLLVRRLQSFLSMRLRIVSEDETEVRRSEELLEELYSAEEEMLKLIAALVERERVENPIFVSF